jgi:hypothetical protein
MKCMETHDEFGIIQGSTPKEATTPRLARRVLTMKQQQQNLIVDCILCIRVAAQRSCHLTSVIAPLRDCTSS